MDPRLARMLGRWLPPTIGQELPVISHESAGLRDRQDGLFLSPGTNRQPRQWDRHEDDHHHRQPQRKPEFAPRAYGHRRHRRYPLTIVDCRTLSISSFGSLGKTHQAFDKAGRPAARQNRLASRKLITVSVFADYDEYCAVVCRRGGQTMPRLRTVAHANSYRRNRGGRHHVVDLAVCRRVAAEGATATGADIPGCRCALGKPGRRALVGVVYPYPDEFVPASYATTGADGAARLSHTFFVGEELSLVPDENPGRAKARRFLGDLVRFLTLAPGCCFTLRAPEGMIYENTRHICYGDRWLEVSAVGYRPLAISLTTYTGEIGNLDCADPCPGQGRASSGRPAGEFP